MLSLHSLVAVLYLDRLVTGACGHARAVIVIGDVVNEIIMILVDAARLEHRALVTPPRLVAPGHTSYTLLEMATFCSDHAHHGASHAHV